jgi:hypothetical protein
MWKSFAAVIVVGSIGVAHADEPTLGEAPAAEEQPAAADPAAEQPAPPLVEEPARVVPPSAYAPRRARPVVEQTAAEPYETPPLSAGRLVGEAAIGGLFALGGGIGGAFVGYQLEMNNGCGGEFCGLAGAALGGVAGMALITPVGVYMVGNTDGQTGSLGATIGGSVVGTLVGIAAVGVSQNEAGVVMLFAGPVIGSMIGFNATRKYVEGHRARNWAPVANASQGNASLGLVGRF